MNQTVRVQSIATQKETKDQLKAQITQYVTKLPESKQMLHKWMMRLEVLALGLILAAFIVAIYMSIAWKSVNPLLIPISWFAFAASAGLLAILLGLHTAMLRVYPPIVLPGIAHKFQTGNRAVWSGLGTIVLGLVVTGFWSTFAYATWTQNWAMLEPMIGFLGTVMGIGMAISIIAGMVKTTIQKLSKLS